MAQQQESPQDVFSLMSSATQKVNAPGENRKTTNYVKKVTLDLDQEHLDIIENYQKKEGVHCGLRGTVWEALELLAAKYGL